MLARLFLLILAAGFLYGAGSMDIGIARSVAAHVGALAWPTTTGVVTRSTAAPIDGAPTPDIAYAYTIDGQRFETGVAADQSFFTPIGGAAIALTRQRPVGAQVVVHYDARQPSRSALDAGVDGGDLMALLAALPFNMGALFLLSFPLTWIGVFGNVGRDGGVRSFEQNGRLYVRLPFFRPILSGVLMTFAMSLLGLFAAGWLSSRLGPRVDIMLVVWAVVIGAVAAVTARQLWKQRQGLADIIIDAATRTVDIPAVEGRKRRVLIPFDDIADVNVESTVRRGPRGSLRYNSAISLRPTPARAGENWILANWGDEERAEEFAKWLRPKLT